MHNRSGRFFFVQGSRLAAAFIHDFTVAVFVLSFLVFMKNFQNALRKRRDQLF